MALILNFVFSHLSCVISDQDILSALQRNRPQLAKAGPQLQPQSREGEGSRRRWLGPALWEGKFGVGRCRPSCDLASTRELLPCQLFHIL